MARGKRKAKPRSGRTRLVFVLSRIGASRSAERSFADKVLCNIIEPALKRRGTRVERLDARAPPGRITEQLVRRLLDAWLVVADVTDQVPGGDRRCEARETSPNVAYELGIRHAWSLPAIQMAHEKTQLPFDIRDFNTVWYGNPGAKAEQAKARRGLRNQVCQIEGGEGSVESFDRAIERRARRFIPPLLREQLRQDFLLLRRALQDFCREVDKEICKTKPGSGAALAALVAGDVADFQARWRLLGDLARPTGDQALDSGLSKCKVVFRRWNKIRRMCMGAMSAGGFAAVVRRTEGLMGYLDKAAEEVPEREAS